MKYSARARERPSLRSSFVPYHTEGFFFFLLVWWVSIPWWVMSVCGRELKIYADGCPFFFGTFKEMAYVYVYMCSVYIPV